jgi:peptide-methionine (S)-S-oxide reductase
MYNKQMNMRNSGLLVCFIAALSMVGCSGHSAQHIESRGGVAVLPALKPGEAVANFAGGCFWAMQECMIELKGVNHVVSGYAGGTTKNPDYETVLQKNTGHAESVQVYYDPKVISFEQLSEAFFMAHDPTQIDGQGPDLGSDYRSIAFYRNKTEYATILRVIDKVSRTGHYPDPIVTELLPAKVFYPAEAEHQDYYPNNPWDMYIRNVSKPKVMKLRHSLPQLIKPEYQ